MKASGLFICLLALVSLNAFSADFCETVAKEICRESNAPDSLHAKKFLTVKQDSLRDIFIVKKIDPTGADFTNDKYSKSYRVEAAMQYYSMLQAKLSYDKWSLEPFREILRTKIQGKKDLNEKKRTLFLKAVNEVELETVLEFIELERAGLKAPSEESLVDGETTADYENYFSMLRLRTVCNNDGSSMNASFNQYTSDEGNLSRVFVCPGELIKSTDQNLNPIAAQSAFTIGHELSHSIDYSQVEGEKFLKKFMDPYSKAGRCFKRKYSKYDGAFKGKYKKSYWNEVIADYWASEVLLEFLKKEKTVESARALFLRNLTGMCGKNGEDQLHPTSKTRIEVILLMNPEIRKTLGCGEVKKHDECFVD